MNGWKRHTRMLESAVKNLDAWKEKCKKRSITLILHKLSLTICDAMMPITLTARLYSAFYLERPCTVLPWASSTTNHPRGKICNLRKVWGANRNFGGLTYFYGARKWRWESATGLRIFSYFYCYHCNDDRRVDLLQSLTLFFNIHIIRYYNNRLIY